MKGIMVIYLTIVMFMAIAESEGYHGATFSNVTVEELENISYQYTNSSSFLEPLRATAGFLNIFISIIVKSLIFQYTIDGAPDVVNFIIRSFFFILSWLAFYDFVVVLINAVLGVLGRVL